jgi:hypothetical protein
MENLGDPDEFGDEAPTKIKDDDFLGFTYVPSKSASPSPSTPPSSPLSKPDRPALPPSPSLGSRKRASVVVAPKGNKITVEDFEVKKLIGRGSFGKVFLVKKKDTGKVCSLIFPQLF